MATQTKIDRKGFIRSVARWGLLGLLATISVLLAARATTSKNDCTSCPSATGCTSKDNCPL
ncbi:MAG: hypothetical protein R6W67_00945 [Bacteroidales bacterium]